MNKKEMLLQHAVLMRLIRPILAGHKPETQGSVLADLTAYWLAGFPAEVRQELFDNQVTAIWEMVPLNAAEIRGADEH